VTNESILAVLKFSGPVVGLIAALWSTTQKITYEAEGGVKRLTLQGRVLIGIITVAALISILALGFGTIVEKQAAADKKLAEQQAAAETKAKEGKEADEKARARAEAAALRQAGDLAHLLEKAEEQKRDLKQSFLIIRAAAAQQRRDAQISMQIGREANQRLSEAERTLAEFERINYPLRSVEARAELSLNFEGVDMAGFWTEIEANKGLESRRKRRYEPDDVIVTFRLSDFSRSRYRDRLDYATTGTEIRLDFVTPEAAFNRPAGSGTDEIRPIEAPTSVSGPVFVTLKLETIEADLSGRRMTAYFSGKYEPQVEGVIGSGDKLSLSDVNKLVPILNIQRPGAQGDHRRGPDTLVGVWFSLNGIQRFGASSSFRIADKGSFVLHPQSPRR